MALGAFLAGMVVGRSDFSLRAASDALPMRDAFAVLFFVSVGMLLDPRCAARGARADRWRRSASCCSASRWSRCVDRPGCCGYPLRIGADGRRRAGADRRVLVHPRDARPRARHPHRRRRPTRSSPRRSSRSSLNPLLYRAIEPVERWVAARPRLWRGCSIARDRRRPERPPTPSSRPPSPRHRAVVVGYGPTGRTVSRLLRENGIEPTVVELNMDTVRAAARGGHRRRLRRRDPTRHAGGGRRGRRRQPDPHVGRHGEQRRGDPRGARAEPAASASWRAPRTCATSPALQQAGADSVFSGEGEVALAFTEAILDELGATPEQIDRERARVARRALLTVVRRPSVRKPCEQYSRDFATSTVYGLRSTVYGLRSTVYGLRTTDYGLITVPSLRRVVPHE